jgi:hypothetical protein
MSQAPLHIKGALIWQGAESIEKDLFIQNGRIVPQKPNHALEVDLSGYTLFPGLVNAHDHLELNHFPRTKFREVYDNAHQWGEDVNARLNDEPFKTLRSYPLWDRVFIGGLKNLLCGATTVAHHGPKHKPMYRKDFPVRVLKNYGWAHSLHFSSEAEIVKSYQSTPKDWPWFIHLAEGTDSQADAELRKLNSLISYGSNALYVHGVGINTTDIAREALGKVIRCPSTNYYLLGQKSFDKPFNSYRWVLQGKYPLIGSDSRLTADGDLLDEIRFTAKSEGKDLAIGLIFQNLWWQYPKWHESTMPPDFLVLPNVSNFDDYFCGLSRKDLPMVIFNGIPQIGTPELMAKFPQLQTIACTLDGVEKRINVELARQVHRCTLKEQGLELDALPNKRKFIFF